MKNYLKQIAIILFLPLLSLIQGCGKSEKLVTGTNPIIQNPKVKTYVGPSKPLGGGTGQAWIAVDSVGNPNAVGINLSEKTLDSLPANDTTYVFQLPNAGKNFYTHVVVQWKPQGAELSDTFAITDAYNLPLLEFYFYIIPESQRMAIKLSDTAQFAKKPAVKYLPDHYIPIPGGAEQIGGIWIDTNAPKRNGTIFETIAWGVYNGNIIFLEPMISKDYLLTHPNDLVNIGQPQRFQKDGWYPTSYQLAFASNPNQYIIALTNLVFQKGQ